MSFEHEIKQIISNKKNTNNILFKYTWYLKSFSFDYIINISEFNNKFYIEYDENNFFIGIDNCITYKPNNKKELLNLKNEIYDNHIIISKGKNFENSTKIFGIIPFNIDTEPSYPWENTPKSIFYIPKILIYKSNNKYYMTFHIKINSNSNITKIINEKNKLKKLIEKSQATEYKKPKLNLECMKPNKKEYSKIFENYMKSIKNKDIKKIILSRMKLFNNKNLFNKNYIIKNLDNNCSKFLFEYNKNNYFIGASPEKLISKKGTKFSTEALAGSISKNNKNKYRNFLKNKKELQEHCLVIDDIKNKLQNKVKSMIVKNNPIIKTYNHIHHLYTPINGELNKNHHIINLLLTLYPTSAILGLPSNIALSKIKSNENFDRGWYGGCFGWFDNNGNGRFDVSIRSGLIQENKLYLFAGSGIVENSNKKDEWNETEIKFKQILSYFIEE